MTKKMKIIGLEGFPLVKQGDDLAQLIFDTALEQHVNLDDGDVVVVAHKVLSKAEGRMIRLGDIRPSKQARKIAKTALKDPKLVQLVLDETKKLVKASSEILIVENKQGYVCINAGVDKSNVKGHDGYILLPEKPDESARRIRSRIMRLSRKNVAVIITDTYSRPFRRGQVEFAIGIAGINPFRDYRDQMDLFGNILKVKNVAIADEIASAAELVMGQGKEGIPVAIVKGLEGVNLEEDISSQNLLISEAEDLFRGTL